MKYDRKNVNDSSEEESPKREETRESAGRPETRSEDLDTPSQQSQKMPFDPERNQSKDEEIERALEERNRRFRAEDKDTNASGDPRIGTHDRKY